MMHHTNQLELQAQIGASYWDCFKGVNLRRTEIACIVWLIQTISGSPLMGQATYFLTAAGLSPSMASTLNLVMFAVGGIGTASSWFLMKPFGRRDLYLYGQCMLVGIMLITAILGTVDRTSKGAQYGIAGLLILFTFIYDITIGPVCYSLVAEIGSTRLRSKTVVLARNLYNVGGIIVGVLNPYMLNSSEWNLGPKSGYLWAATGTIGLIWTFFRLPEPKVSHNCLIASSLPVADFQGTILRRVGHLVRTEDSSKEVQDHPGPGVRGCLIYPNRWRYHSLVIVVELF